MSIQMYGWNSELERQWNETYTDDSLFPGRIVADYGQKLRVITNMGEYLVDRPVKRIDLQLAVGDWVALKQGEWETMLFIDILPRKSKFSRKAAGIEVKEQIVAANIDFIFLMQSLNNDFNVQRLERYVVAAWESGATPVIVLTKVDLCEDVFEKLRAVYEAIPGVDVHTISNVTGEGIDQIKSYFTPGKTVVLLGSSGIGKSTLVNQLIGEETVKTQEIREKDGKGRHTTTRRELRLLSNGGLILDTPGMRELALWNADAGMDVLFSDIGDLAKQCRFRDCRHENEPGCAVKAAIEAGTLDQKKYANWMKLQKELSRLEAKKQGKLKLLEKQQGKQFGKIRKELNSHRKRKR